MDIRALKKIILPPAEPVHTGTFKDWDAICNAIGLRLPSDYFEVARTFGSGRFFSGTLEIANPLDPDYSTWVEFELAPLREFRKAFPADVPYAIYPEPAGLYPFGRDDNGNTFLWLTQGDPDEWPIICRSESDLWESVQHPLSEFLTLLVTNKLEINQRAFWGSPFSKERRVFEPRQAPRSRMRSSKRVKR